MKRLQLRLSRRLLDNMTNMVMSWMTEGAGKLAFVSVLLVTQGKKDNQLNFLMRKWEGKGKKTFEELIQKSQKK